MALLADNRDCTGTGKVFLIGAGPGDPKLLTLKAAETLAASDVIIFDYLVNPEVLVHAKRGAELVYAGKRAGVRAVPQSEINRLMIEAARQGKTVARLKGGDPFVFGRGGEEAEALVEAGIEWEIIPGISSGIAAAAYAGIPITHRRYGSTVSFITGHESPDKESPAIDWRAYANVGTLVVFMCGKTIARIASELIAAGRDPSTPIAVIRWATYQEQEVYYGVLADVAAFSASDNGNQFESPAIAIVGEVVALREKLRWFGSREREYPIGEGNESEFSHFLKASYGEF